MRAQRATGAAVERHPAPAERDPRRRPLFDLEQRGLDRRVEQRRVDRVAAGGGSQLLLWQGDFGEQLLATAPDRAHPLEGGAVLDSQRCRTLVEVVDRDRLGPRRRPLIEARGVGWRGGGERATGVAHPLPLPVVLDSRVDRQRAPAVLIGRPDRDLYLRRPPLGKQQRRLDRQLLDRLGAGLLPDPQRHLQEGGARQDRRAVDGMVGEPRVGLERDPAAEQPLVTVGQLQRGAEDRVLGGGLPDRGGVAGLRCGLQPEASALEGVGREVDLHGRVRSEEGTPVDAGSTAVGGGKSADKSLGVLPALAQERRQGGVGVPERAPGHRAEHAVGSELQVGVDTLGVEILDPVLEADGLANLACPVGRRGRFLSREQRSGQVGDDRDPGSAEGESRGDLLELRQHRLHQLGVEGVADLEPGRLTALGLPGLHQLQGGLLLPGDNYGVGVVDPGDREAVWKISRDLLLARLDRDHRPALGKGAHQPAPGRDQAAGVGEREHAGDMRGGQLADRVADQEVGLRAPGLDQPEQRNLGREQRRLGQLGAIQGFGLWGSFGSEEVLLEGKSEVVVHLLADRVEGIGISREVDVEAAAHARALGTLAGEHEGGLAGAGGAAVDAGMRLARGQGVEGLQQSITIGSDGHRATRQCRPAAGQRVADIDQIEIGIPAQVRRQAPGLRRQRLLGFGRQGQWHGGER